MTNRQERRRVLSARTNDSAEATTAVRRAISRLPEIDADDEGPYAARVREAGVSLGDALRILEAAAEILRRLGLGAAEPEREVPVYDPRAPEREPDHPPAE